MSIQRLLIVKFTRCYVSWGFLCLFFFFFSLPLIKEICPRISLPQEPVHPLLSGEHPSLHRAGGAPWGAQHPAGLAAPGAGRRLEEVGWLCRAQQLRLVASSGGQRPGPSGVTVLGAARLRFGRIATFNACWPGWFETTSKAKPWHRGKAPTQLSPHGWRRP